MDSHFGNTFGNFHFIRKGSTGNIFRIRHQRHTAQCTSHIRNNRPLCPDNVLLLKIVFGFHCHHTVPGFENISSHSFFRLLDAIYFRLLICRKIIIPRSITDMLLYHHVLPFTSRHHIVIVIAQVLVTLKRLFNLVGPIICLRIILLVKLMVHSLRIVHFIQIGHCLHREKNQLLIRILIFLLECHILAQCFRFELNKLIRNLLPLSGLQIISLAVKHFSSNPTGIFAI